jgi:hypothetical protein
MQNPENNFQREKNETPPPFDASRYRPHDVVFFAPSETTSVCQRFINRRCPNKMSSSSTA